MMRRFLFFWFSVFVFSNLSGQTPTFILSDQAGWHRIYRTSLDSGKTEKEVIVFLADRFSALRFEIKNPAIQPRLVRVLFEDASIREFKVADSPNKNKDKKELLYPLKENKKINRILFVYHLEQNPKANDAELEIWGLKE